MVTADVTQTNPPWGLDRIDQRNRPLSGTYTYNFTGSGVRAYVIDTGIRTTHTQFGGRASNVFDAFGGSGADCNGHGTHVRELFEGPLDLGADGQDAARTCDGFQSLREVRARRRFPHGEPFESYAFGDGREISSLFLEVGRSGEKRLERRGVGAVLLIGHADSLLV